MLNNASKQLIDSIRLIHIKFGARKRYILTGIFICADALYKSSILTFL